MLIIIVTAKIKKNFFVFIAYDDGNDFTQTHVCIQSV